MYDDKGRLTRAGAEAVIRSGGSVSIGGQIITQAANLPGEAEFARGDTKAEDAARARLRQQQADIQRQLDALGTAGGGGPPARPGDDPGGGVRTITGADFGPRPARATNAGAFPAAPPPGETADPAAYAKAGAAGTVEERKADAAADKADADEDARARKGKGK